MAKEKKTIRDSVKEETQSFLTELKKFSREAGELAQHGGKEISRVSQIAKLKGGVLILNQKRERKLKELGERVLLSVEKFGIEDPEVIKIIEEIKTIEEEKISAQEKVKKLSKK